jgi:putative ABC transport system ATP-binding protein
MELLTDVAVQPGRAVIVVTHDSRVFRFGNRIVTMNDGRVVGVEESNHRDTEDRESRIEDRG